MENVEYRSFLNKEYDSLREAGIKTLSTVGITAPSYKVMQDPRHSLDLQFELPKQASEVIQKKVLQPLSELFEQKIKAPQTIFEPDWLHVSLVIILAAEVQPPFDKLKDPVDKYKAVISECLEGVGQIDFYFGRVIPFPGNPGGIAVGGYPKDESLQQLREKIKSAIDQKGLRRYERRASTMWHSTLARWETPVKPDKAEDVIEFVNSLDHQEIWSGKLERINYCIGGYNTSPENTELLAAYLLK